MGELKVHDIPMVEIHEDESFNCRGKITPMDVVELAKDIEREGLIQPIILAPYSEEKKAATGKTYRLIAGYRRFTAFKILNKLAIPAIVRPDMMNDLEARFFNLQENLQRQNLNIMQEALTLKSLRELGITETDAAERIGKSRGWVQVRYMLLALPEQIQKEVLAGTVTQPQIRELYTLMKRGGEDAAFNAAKKIKAAKARGHIITVNPDISSQTKPRLRKRGEIFFMMDHLRESIGIGVWSRVLAWAAGEISDMDMNATLKIVCDKMGKPYTPFNTDDLIQKDTDSEIAENTAALGG